MLIMRQLITPVDYNFSHPTDLLRIINLIRIEICIMLLSSQVIIKLLLMIAQLGEPFLVNQIEPVGYMILQVA